MLHGRNEAGMERAPTKLVGFPVFPASAWQNGSLSHNASANANVAPVHPVTDRVANDSRSPSNNQQTLIDLITAKENCDQDLTPSVKSAWPDCVGKMAWMAKMWTLDSCYKGKGEKEWERIEIGSS